MFAITDHKGFQITFENGWTVSVQWGLGNYADHMSRGVSTVYPNKVDKWTSDNAEVAAWDHLDRWFQFPTGDEVRGYTKPDDVAKFIAHISNLPRAT